MDPKLTIIEINENNIKEYGEHKVAIIKRSGVDENPIYNPYNKSELMNFKWSQDALLSGLKKPLTTPGWRRSWGAQFEDETVGSLDLSGGAVTSILHRCELMMGVSEGHKEKGIGTMLVDFSKSWAKDNGIKYIDLGVFHTNEPAYSLYKKCGFNEIGKKENAYIISSVSITMIQMTFKV